MVKIIMHKRMGELKISQAELARKTGIRRNTINEMYHNLSKRLSVDNLNVICKSLNCSISDVLEYVPDESLPK